MREKKFVFSKNAIEYTWRQLLLRAGVDLEELSYGPEYVKFNDITLYYSKPVINVNSRKSIFILPCSSDGWNDLLRGQSNNLERYDSQHVFPKDAKPVFKTIIPVLFWGADVSGKHKLFVQDTEDEQVIFNADIIASSFFMLSRVEELFNPVRDAHDRFPANASVAYQQNFLDIPLVDQYALILREWIKKLIPTWTPKISKPRINLTHDIDSIVKFPTPVSFFRSFGSALLKEGNISKSLNHLKDLCGQIFSPQKDVYFQSIYILAALSEGLGLKSSFYFMAADQNAYQQGYDFSLSRVAGCFRDLTKNGHEIGFHPSYFTLNNVELFKKEKNALEIVLGHRLISGRQHYLRFNVPYTWRVWEDAGFSYDSTTGYADYEGFRCGTCWPYHPFDIERDCEMKIKEIPLIVMDATLFHYRKLQPKEGKRKILELAGRCVEVGGVFTILWHNSSLNDDWAPWFKEYSDALSEIVNLMR